MSFNPLAGIWVFLTLVEGGKKRARDFVFQSPGGDLGFSHFIERAIASRAHSAQRFNPLAGIWVFLTQRLG